MERVARAAARTGGERVHTFQDVRRWRTPYGTQMGPCGGCSDCRPGHPVLRLEHAARSDRTLCFISSEPAGADRGRPPRSLVVMDAPGRRRRAAHREYEMGGWR